MNTHTPIFPKHQQSLSLAILASSSLFGRLWSRDFTLPRRFFHLHMWCPCWKLLQIFTDILPSSNVPLQGGGGWSLSRWGHPAFGRERSGRRPFVATLSLWSGARGKVCPFVCQRLCSNFKQQWVQCIFIVLCLTFKWARKKGPFVGTETQKKKNLLRQPFYYPPWHSNEPKLMRNPVFSLFLHKNFLFPRNGMLEEWLVLNRYSWFLSVPHSSQLPLSSTLTFFFVFSACLELFQLEWSATCQIFFSTRKKILCKIWVPNWLRQKMWEKVGTITMGIPTSLKMAQEKKNNFFSGHNFFSKWPTWMSGCNKKAQLNIIFFVLTERQSHVACLN